MAKIKIDFPENVLATFEIPVRITDINYGNHLGNDSFVSILHEARMQWLARYGFTELKIEGAGLIMAALAIEFKAEAFYGESLQVELAVAEVSKVKFEIFYRVKATRNGTDILIALGQTVMVSYDYKTSRPVPIPSALLNLFDMNNPAV